jgi:hypothetical protein
MLLMNSFDQKIAVATPPMIGHGFGTICPSEMIFPTSTTHVSQKPQTISIVQVIRSFGDIVLQDASSISIVLQDVTPV